MKAAVIVMDRGVGKPIQIVKHGGAIGSYDLSKLSDEQIRLQRELLRIAAPATIGDTD
jgi:hypothetical protein